MTNTPSSTLRLFADDSWKMKTGTLPFTLTNDYLFRAVLQSSNNTLKNLLSALLELPRSSIISCEIQNPIILGSAIDHKTCILDILILLNNNQRINLEMQVGNLDYWQNRSIFYLSKMFCSLKRGEDYSSLLPSIHIGILSHSLTPKTPFFYSKYMLCEIHAHQVFSSNFALHVLDLSQLDNVSEAERSSELYRWARIFKATTWEELRTLTKDSRELQEGISCMYKLTSEEQIQWQCLAREMYEMDQQVARRTAERIAKEAEKASKEIEKANKEIEKANKEIEKVNKKAEKASKEAEEAKQALKEAEKSAKEAERRGYDAGYELINQLNHFLIRDNRIEDLKASILDQAYQQKLLKEYKLVSGSLQCDGSY